MSLLSTVAAAYHKFPFFSIPFVVFAFFSLSLLSIFVTQIRGHIAGSSPRSPLLFLPFIFVTGRHEPFFPSSTRVELRLPILYRRAQQLVLFFTNISEISLRRELNSRANAILTTAFEGNHY